MDILTHALMGAVGASALWPAHPEASAAFAFGSVLPDLDALARLLGKRAFLAAHQTWTHGLPVIGGVGLAAWAAREALGVHAPWAPLLLAAGMALHALCDWTNTYGVALLAPLSLRRSCAEWVFFVDAPVLVATAVALAAVGLGSGGGVEVQAAWAALLAAYVVAKALLRRRALRHAPPGTRSLLPSALVPWRFLGLAVADGRARTFQVDARTGAVTAEREHALLDARFAAPLAAVPVVATLRALSAGFHAVEAEARGGGATLVRCRDLRTRNFSTTFGAVDLLVGPGDRVEVVRVDV